MDLLTGFSRRLTVALFLLLPSWGWASYQPINGASVLVATTSVSINGSSNTVQLTGAIPAGSNNIGIANIVSTNTLTVQGALADNGVAAATNRLGTLGAIYQQNSQSAAGTAGRDAALVIGTADHSVRFTPSPDISRYSFSGSTNPFTLASNPTYISGLCGNVGNTVLVRGLRVSGTQTTAGMVNVSVKKLSAKYAGAWSTMTLTPEDSNYGLVQSTAVYFTANPTAATEAGHLDDATIGFMASATASPNDIYISPAQWDTKPIVLRGTAQCVVVDLLGQAITGGKTAILWRWTEDSSL